VQIGYGPEGADEQILQQSFRRVMKIVEEDNSVTATESRPICYTFHRGLKADIFIFETMRPYSSVSYVTKAKFYISKTQDDESKREGSYDLGQLGLAVSATNHRLRFVIHGEDYINNSNDKIFRSLAGGKGDPKAPYWTGIVRSNDLVIKVDK